MGNCSWWEIGRKNESEKRQLVLSHLWKANTPRPSPQKTGAFSYFKMAIHDLPSRMQHLPQKHLVRRKTNTDSE